MRIRLELLQPFDEQCEESQDNYKNVSLEFRQNERTKVALQILPWLFCITLWTYLLDFCFFHLDRTSSTTVLHKHTSLRAAQQARYSQHSIHHPSLRQKYPILRHPTRPRKGTSLDVLPVPDFLSPLSLTIGLGWPYNYRG